MLQIRTVVNSELKYLDLFTDEEITMEVSFNELQDITKKNSPFSKTFKLPGSNNNNDIFNHFYDTNSSTFDYNVLQKFEATLVYNGYDLYTGYLRLDNVTRTNTDIVYSVTFYSQVGDLVSNIQGKYLSDLQLYTDGNPTEYIQENYPETLRFTYDEDDDIDLNPSLSANTQPVYNGKLYFPLLNRGYKYQEDTENDTQEVNADIIPRLKWENPPAANVNTLDYWDSDRVPPLEIPARQVPSIYLTGSLRVRDIYESIFRENGYTVNSDFMNTAYFNRYYMPLTVSNEDLYPVQSEMGQYVFGQTGATTATSVNHICSPLTWYEGPTYASGIQVDRLNMSGYTVDTDTFYFNNGTMLLKRTGVYIFRITFDYVTNDDGAFQFSVVQHNLPSSPPFYPTTPCWNSGFTNAASTNVVVTAGDSGEDEILEIEVNTYKQPSELPYYAIDLIKTDPADDIRITKFNIEVIEAPAFTSNREYNPVLEFVKPDIKQLDFISGINKIFNLLVIPEPDDPTTLRVEPIIDWIGKGDTLDWSGKVDRNQPITVQPVTSIINGTLDYTYTDDSSTTNVNFKKLNNRVFGSNVVDLDTDYRDKVTKFDNIFSAHVDEVLNTNKTGVNGFTIPNYYTTEESENNGLNFTQYKPYKTPPKLLFRQPVLPISSFRTGRKWWSLDTYKIENWSSNNRFTTYPFGVSGLTHAAVWNKNDRTNTNEYPLNDYEDLYDVYYKDYVEDLVDPNNRLVRASIYLKPEEVRNLKFNEKIFLDGNYYRINKITGSNLSKPDVATVELVKLTREYNGHRVRYYDLINCTGGTDLHTSTDLNYSVYYLKGYRVSIDGDCYTVSAGTYNSGFTYQALNISEAYTDCGCSTSIDDAGIDPYDELKPLPSPTPTPTNPCGACTYYELENENPYSVVVQWKDCNSLIVESETVGASQIWTGCTCNAYGYRTSGGSLRENFSEPCFPSTPTPTPSVTPTFTSTPTYTPTQTGTPVPTPTNTKTPTTTPTPSTSTLSYTYYYIVEDCDTPMLYSEVGSNNFYPIGKVLKISNGSCAEIIGTSSGPHFTTEIAPYNDCGSCPR